MTCGSDSEKSPSGGRKDIFRDFRQKDPRSAICSSSAKETVELILRDWTMTWLDQRKRMDGQAIKFS
jgi:hypothetical protein